MADLPKYGSYPSVVVMDRVAAEDKPSALMPSDASCSCNAATLFACKSDIIASDCELSLVPVPAADIERIGFDLTSNWRDVSADPHGSLCNSSSNEELECLACVVIVVAARNERQESGMVTTDAAAAANASVRRRR